MNTLIIEDDANVVEAVSLCLQLRWPQVTISVANEGIKGVEILKSEPFDIVILDINLPDMDGFEVLRQTRSFSNVPIIILTVREQEDDQAKGLETGADDYIVKPFRPRDLIARVNSVLRRTRVPETAADQTSIVRGKLRLNLYTNQVQFRDQIVKLTPTECKLLYVLMNNAGDTLSDKRILQEVWGEEYSKNDIVRTYIKKVRHKLNDSPPQIILTKRRGGYTFIEPQ